MVYILTRAKIEKLTVDREKRTVSFHIINDGIDYYSGREIPKDIYSKFNLNNETSKYYFEKIITPYVFKDNYGKYSLNGLEGREFLAIYEVKLRYDYPADREYTALLLNSLISVELADCILGGYSNDR